MITTYKHLAVALLLCMPLLAACDQRQNPPAAGGNGSEPTSALGGVVKKATGQAREQLARGNITISNDHPQLPKAEITPQGHLLIDGRTVRTDASQRALLLDYRAQVVAIATAGMAIGVQGADLASKAVTAAVAGVFSGNSDQVEQRVEKEAEKIEASALQICEQLPAMLETQQKLAAALPEFKPYATMDQDDVDDCRTHTDWKPN